MAATKKPGPHNIGLRDAHQISIKRIFGERGADSFQAIGGLQNRAPLELVSALLSQDLRLQETAKMYFIRNCGRLKNIQWKDDDPIGSVTEVFVTEKMFVYASELGKHPGGVIWPEPCKGFLSLLDSLRELKEKGIPIDLAILSAGHTPFIKKTFKAWGYPLPKVVLSDDEVRYINCPIERKIKPSTFLLYLVQKRLARLHGKINLPLKDAKEMRLKMAYFGDDLERDGELARRAGIPFGWFTPGTIFQAIDNGIRFSDWQVIANHLRDEETFVDMLAGKSMREIFGIA
ncbi:MAG: HAD family hydrolase [Parcubacteria group bacterium]